VEGIPFSCEGMVVQENNILSSPYTGTSSGLYHSITEKFVRKGRSSEWIIVENLVNFVPFIYSDKWGKIKVDLTNMAMIFQVSKLTFETGSFLIADQKVKLTVCQY